MTADSDPSAVLKAPMITQQPATSSSPWHLTASIHLLHVDHWRSTHFLSLFWHGHSQWYVQPCQRIPSSLTPTIYLQIRHVLSEWSSGHYKMVRFTVESLTPKYKRILASLMAETTGDRAPEILAVRQSILDCGKQRAETAIAVDAPIKLR